MFGSLWKRFLFPRETCIGPSWRRRNSMKLSPGCEALDNRQTRWSFVYELTPIQFVQLRGGVRYQDGIPQIDTQHTKLYFVELHGFF